MKYARLRDGRLIDVYRVPEDFADFDTLNRCLPGGDFIMVPDSAENSATDNGDGTYTNPVAVVVTKLPTSLSSTAFQDVCEAGLGGGALGATRFGKIIRDVSVSTDDLIYSAYQRFIKATTFDKAKTAPLFKLLVDNNLMTAQESTAILAAWPST